MRTKIPTVSIIIVAVCAVIGLLQVIYGDAFSYKLAMYEGAIENGEYYRILTSSFVHYGIVHFISNAISIICLGYILEDKIGAIKYIVIYVVSMAGSSLLINFIGGANAMHGGASGAAWGLMGATLVYELRYGYNISGVVKLLLFNLVYTFTSPVSWQGHIGGLIAGVIVSIFIATDKKKSYRAWKRAHPNCNYSFYARKDTK